MMVSQTATAVQLSGQTLQINTTAVGYWALFASTALLCFLGTIRARKVEQDDVRRGLVWLLGTTGIWALLKVAFFTFPVPLREPAYTAGLIFGFGTVWAWLYFCSAYTGREYHRNQTLRRLGTAIILVVFAVKITNPVHGMYFSVTEETEPFVHLAIEHGLFHWIVTGLSYVLATAGIFMLFELYIDSGYDTRPLGVLTVLIGLPIIFDILALLTPRIVGVIYAPVGVGFFAVGVLYIFERRFLAVQQTGNDDDAVIFLDDSGRIRDHSPAAREIFPELAGTIGTELDSVLEPVAELIESDEQLLDWKQDGETRYYLTSKSSVRLGNSEGTVMLFSDVTDTETRRRELARHNEQLEGFASALAHELRNMLQIIDWRLETATDRMDEGTVEYESVETAADANDRLSGLVDDFTTIARYGQTIERLETIDFRTAVEDAWWNVETGEIELVIDGEGELEADPGRLRELLSNAFKFAHLNGAETVSVDLLDGAIAISGDGLPPSDNIEGYFAFGESVPDAESGMKLPNIKTFAKVHGWTVGIDTEYQDGVRLVVSDVTTNGA